ncbi:two-component response regulator-like APRR9 [Cucurbita moschata]|uniref:Two-component response regulator-like APRR9 n=1 Tax=Cucurbita moschata TaxID=3662 RepID=A0A6J1H0Z5_CUCMO|nr:two-component response regulator-like APRR9 [Cucurbita moschata]
MAEAVVATSEGVDFGYATAEIENNRENSSNGLGIGIKWDCFLPKVMLRVLLVEADDSTRQIITALLRKSCYRVAAVPDGMKAWEILKARPRNVDLILAEVELPSMSGFSLLTLIMGHETCKNIPVIMMSSEDSISTVYKCMMKGAADYLVKPLRRNELSHLWQHVWRRQASSNARTDIQEKVEVTSENETASNHSTDYVAGVERNDNNTEKGSDTQSSSTKVDFEAGSKMQESSQPRQEKASSNDFKLQKDGGHINLSQRLAIHENESGGLAMSCYANDDLPITLSMGLEPTNDGRSPYIASEAEDLLANPSRDATALNHACINYPDDYQRRSPSTVAATNNFGSALHLDLSLRRCQPNDFEDRAAEGRATLKHSSASAFTRYTSRPLQTLQAKSSSICDEQKEFGSNPEHIGSIAATPTSDTINTTLSLQNSNTSMPLMTSLSALSEVAKSSTSETEIPHQVTVKDLMSNSQCSGHGSLLSPNLCTQGGASSSPCSTLVTHPEPILAKQTVYPLNLENHNLEQFLNQHPNTSDSGSRKLENSGKKLEYAENQGHISPTTDHSANSSLCGGNTSHVRSVGYPSTCGSNNNVDRVGIAARVTSETKNEEALSYQGGDPHRSSQREAALTKFRLKRKDRCYDKKVRYESRKKLAEQRPRVKGQFVRRVYTDDPLPAESNANTSNG